MGSFSKHLCTRSSGWGSSPLPGAVVRPPSNLCPRGPPSASFQGPGCQAEPPARRLSGRGRWLRVPHFPTRTPKPRLREHRCPAGALSRSPRSPSSEVEEESHRNAADQTFKLIRISGISGTLAVASQEPWASKEEKEKLPTTGDSPTVMRRWWGCPNRGKRRTFREGGGQLALSPGRL